MNAHTLRLLAVVASLAVAGAAASACELVVQLDRGEVDAGEDTGCPICSDATEEGEDAAADAEPDAGPADGGRDVVSAP